ncbi:MAG TPA: tyrosine-type recombinase/integrase [Anaerolineales bacterium]|nr:tyrosine-type recombinase/integrase [Anaerolineales bacterium]
MSTSSVSHQISLCMDSLFLSKEEIDEMKSELGVTSLKRALRKGCDPTRPIPYILSYESYRSYFRAARTFFKRAQLDSGKKLLKDLLNRNVILATYEKYYTEQAPGTVSKAQSAIKKVYEGALKLGWVKGPCPIENDFRDRMRVHYRPPRYGYQPKDAQRIVSYLVESKSSCALAAKLSLYCGLREHEVAGLMGEHIDRKRKVLCITGKNGRYREVPIPERLLPELTVASGYLFTPSRSWRNFYWQEVSKADKNLGIEITGVHRLRSTYAQMKYSKLRSMGADDKSARQEVSKLLGHGRRSVTFHYIPECFDWETYREYISLYD